MAISLVRTVILYILVTAAVRIMGKRQIGELQPTELVTTILLSELAAIPMQDNDIPMLNSVVSVLILLAFEILSSYISLKLPSFRKLTEGNPVYVIKKGKVIEKDLKKLRFTADDLMEALRQKDVFDIKEVEYAIVETNGTLSVMLKPGKKPLCPDDIKIEVEDNGIPWVIISDGKIISKNLKECNLTLRNLGVILKAENKNVEDILLMTVDEKGGRVIVEKSEKEAGKYE